MFYSIFCNSKLNYMKFNFEVIIFKYLSMYSHLDIAVYPSLFPRHQVFTVSIIMHCEFSYSWVLPPFRHHAPYFTCVVVYHMDLIPLNSFFFE